MPRVQRVTERSASPQLGPMPQAQAPSTNPLAIAGQAAGQVSEQVAKIQLDELAKADFAQRTLADTQLNDISFKLSSEATALRGMDALDLPGKFEPKFAEATAGMAASMRTEEQRAWFAGRVAAQRQSFLGTLQGHERSETERVYNEVDQQGIKSYTDAARAGFRDEAVVGDSINQLTGLIERRGARLGLPKELVQQESADAASGARVEVVQGWADAEDLRQAETALKRHSEGMTAADRNRAENLVATLRAKKKQEAETAAVLSRFDLTQRMQDIRARAMDGLDVGPVPSERELVAAFGAERGSSMYRDALTWQKTGTAMAGIVRLPANEIPGVIDSFTPGEQMGSAETLQAKNALRVAASQVLAAREKDPGGFLVQNDPKLQGLWNTAISGKSAAERAAAAKTYMALAGARARQLQITNTNLIPAGYGKQFAGALMASESAEASVNALLGEQDKWGDQWPRVFGEIGGDLSGMHRIAASGIARPAAKVLASLGQMKTDERNAALDAQLPTGTTANDIKRAVDARFIPFYRTFPVDANGQAVVGDMRDAATALAKTYARDGLPSHEAASRAYADIAGNEPLGMANGREFRMPLETAGTNTDAIEVGGNWLISEFRADASMIVGNSLVTPGENYADRLTAMIREDGMLVTSKGADGVDLYVGSEPVFRNGEIVHWSWQQLRDAGASVEAKVRAAPTPEWSEWKP